MNVEIRRLDFPLPHLISSVSSGILEDKDVETFEVFQSLGEVYTGYIDGKFVCCWGLISPSFLSSDAYLWMWWAGTDVPHKTTFIRHSVNQIGIMLSRFDRIVGYCTEGSPAIRWLTWLGAEFEQSPQGGKVKFSIRRSADG